MVGITKKHCDASSKTKYSRNIVVSSEKNIVTAIIIIWIIVAKLILCYKTVNIFLTF